MEQEQSRETVISWLWRAVKGALIGLGAILPGISGGVLSIIFGIYKPMMEFLAHPIKSFKSQFKFFLPIVIGFGAGFILLSKGVEWLFDTYPSQALWLFIGLIVGTIPSLFREAGEQGRSKNAWLSLVICFGVMLAFLLLVNEKVSTTVQPNILWYVVCGVFWGLGMIVPGMSPSNFIMYLGLYEPMLAGIGNLDFAVIIPIGVGLVLVLLLLARVVNALFERAYAVCYHGILGVVVASTVALIVQEGGLTSDKLLACAACFVVGVIIAYLMDVLGQKLEGKKAQELE